jgi:hypothetical protein
MIIGVLLTTCRSHVPVFAVAGVLHPLSFVVILLVVRKIQMAISVEGSLLNTSSAQA